MKDNPFIEIPKTRKKLPYLSSICHKVKKNRFIDLFLNKKKIETTIHYPKMLINLKPYKVFKIGKDFRNCVAYENKYSLCQCIHFYLKRSGMFVVL